MHSGAPGYELDRAEAQLKTAGIGFFRHSKNIKIPHGSRYRSYFLEIAVGNERRFLRNPDEVRAAIAQIRAL